MAGRFAVCKSVSERLEYGVELTARSFRPPGDRGKDGVSLAVATGFIDIKRGTSGYPNWEKKGKNQHLTLFSKTGQNYIL